MGAEGSSDADQWPFLPLTDESAVAKAGSTEDLAKLREAHKQRPAKESELPPSMATPHPLERGAAGIGNWSSMGPTLVPRFDAALMQMGWFPMYQPRLVWLNLPGTVFLGVVFVDQMTGGMLVEAILGKVDILSECGVLAGAFSAFGASLLVYRLRWRGVYVHAAGVTTGVGDARWRRVKEACPHPCTEVGPARLGWFRCARVLDIPSIRLRLGMVDDPSGDRAMIHSRGRLTEQAVELLLKLEGPLFGAEPPTDRGSPKA